MKEFRLSWRLAPFVALTMAILLLAACGGDPNGDPSDDPTATPDESAGGVSFEGETLTFIVGWDPGSSSDLQARVLMEHMPKHLPGNPRMQVTNMPGASAMIAANYVANSGPEGHVAFYGPGYTYERQLVFGDEAEYDYLDIPYVGSFEVRPTTWNILGDAPYDRIQDAVGGSEEFTWGTEVETASTVGVVNLLKEHLDLPVRIVFGISGGFTGTLQALERRDVESIIGGSDWMRIPGSRPGWYSDGYIEPFAIVADPSVTLPSNGEIDPPDDLMNIRDLVEEEQRRELDLMLGHDGVFYRHMALPTGTPREVQEVWVQALRDTVADPEFVAEIEEITGRPLDGLVDGFEMDALNAEIELEAVDAVFRKYNPAYESPLD